MTAGELIALAGVLAVLIGSWTGLNMRLASVKKDVGLLRSNGIAHIREELIKIGQKLDERPCGEHEVKLEETSRRLAAIERRGE